MNKITKKRRINDENREFNLKWTFDYFFINNNNKAWLVRFCSIVLPGIWSPIIV